MSKITLLFISIFLCFAQVAISQEAIKITIELEGQSLKSALCKLGEINDHYRFIFQDKIPDELIIESQKFEDNTMFQILDALLVDSDLSFVVICYTYSSRVVIYKMSETIQSQETTPITVTGRVLDWEGRPAWGALVYTKPNSNVFSFNAIFISDGNFVIATDSPNSYAVDVNCDDGAFIITVDNPNTYLIVLVDAENLPRVVHINDAELIQLELDKEFLERTFIIGCPCRVVEE